MKRSDFTNEQVEAIFKKHSTIIHKNRTYFLDQMEPFYFEYYPNDRKKVKKVFLSKEDAFILRDDPEPIPPKKYRIEMIDGIRTTIECR